MPKQSLKLRRPIQGIELVTLIQATKVLAIRCIERVYWDSQQPAGSKLGLTMTQMKYHSDLKLTCPARGYRPISLLQPRAYPKKANVHNL